MEAWQRTTGELQLPTYVYRMTPHDKRQERTIRRLQKAYAFVFLACIIVVLEIILGAAWIAGLARSCDCG